MRRFSLACALILCTGSCAFGEVDFNRQIRPILSQSCFAVMAWMRPRAIYDWTSPNLPTRVGSRADGNRSGKARESELMLRVTAHGQDRMPSKGDALSDDQISLLRQWIKEGAVTPSIGHTKSPSARKFLRSESELYP